MSDIVIELRTYRLTPGSSREFHRLFVEESVPLLRRFGVRVLRFGPSETDEDGVIDYLLMRAFDSMADRDAAEERFYGSSDWRDGPRAGVMAAIESYHTVVLTVPEESIAGWRQ